MLCKSNNLSQHFQELLKVKSEKPVEKRIHDVHELITHLHKIAPESLFNVMSIIEEELTVFTRNY